MPSSGGGTLFDGFTSTFGQNPEKMGNGYGRFIYESGDYYEGYFDNKLGAEATGRLIKADGSLQTGKLKNWKFLGRTQSP